MQTKLTIHNPGDIEASITITMPVRQWIELQKQLSRSPPSWELSAAITELAREVTKTLHWTPGETGEA